MEFVLRVVVALLVILVVTGLGGTIGGILLGPTVLSGLVPAA